MSKLQLESGPPADRHPESPKHIWVPPPPLMYNLRDLFASEFPSNMHTHVSTFASTDQVRWIITRFPLQSFEHALMWIYIYKRLFIHPNIHVILISHNKYNNTKDQVLLCTWQEKF